MSAFVRLLEEHAARCIELAYQCRTKSAERFLRLLAVDLMLAAEMHRPRGSGPEEELSPLERLARGKSRPVKPESASTT